MAHKTCHVVYGVVEREFVQMDNVIIKIGHTTQPFPKRLSQYPNDSQMVFTLSIRSNRSKDAEDCILRMLRNHEDVICRCDIGAEYFEITRDVFPTLYIHMQSLMVSHKFLWNGYEDTICDSNDDIVASNGVSTPPQFEEHFGSVHDFIKANIDELSEKTFDQNALVTRIESSLKTHDNKIKFTSSKILSALKTLGCIPVNQVFDGILPVSALRFPDLKKHQKVSRFLHECCIACGADDPSDSALLYAGFTQFCTDNDLSMTLQSVEELGEIIQELGNQCSGIILNYSMSKLISRLRVSRTFKSVHLEFLHHCLSLPEFNHNQDVEVIIDNNKLVEKFEDFASNHGYPIQKPYSFHIKMSSLTHKPDKNTGIPGFTRKKTSKARQYAFHIPTIRKYLYK